MPSISSLCPKMEASSTTTNTPEISQESSAPFFKTETPLLNQLLGFSAAASQPTVPNFPVLDFTSPLTCIPEVPFGEQFTHDIHQYFGESHERMLLDQQGTIWTPMDAFDMQQLDNGQLFLTSHQDWNPSAFPLEMPIQEYAAPSPMYSLSDGSDYQVRTPPLESSLSHYSNQTHGKPWLC